MVGLTRWSPFEDLFNFQREVDRFFNQFWSDLPARTADASPGAFQVSSSDDEGWKIEVPMPGIDPQHVTLEVAGNTLNIRAEVPSEGKERNTRTIKYEQTINVPPFLDLDKLTAANRHGMLELRLPVKESVKPRRVQIAVADEERKQLTGV